MQILSQSFQHIWQTLNPRRSLRARMALTFGFLVISLTVGLVVWLEFTAVTETITLNTLIARLEQQIWVSGLVLTIAFVTISWIIAGRISRPLHIVAEAARELHEEGQEHVIPTFSGRDEIASLSRSLNILVANLRTQQKALREANDLLEQRVIERTRQLATLYDVLEISSEKESLTTLLDRALSRILRESRAGVGCIHLIDRDSLQLTMACQFQMREPLVNAYARLPFDHPVVQDTLRQESFWLITNAQAAAYDPELFRTMKQQQALCLPIRGGGRDLGILTVFAKENVFFEGDETTLLSSLADQLGIMIENERLRQQAEQLALVDERNRLARELHDSVTQALYSATLFAEAGQKQARAGNMEKALAHLDDVVETSRQALKEMRLLVHKLRPSTLDKEGLIRALDQRLKAVEERAGIKQNLIVTGSRTFPVKVEETLYHIAVEALNNSLKHARATAVTITIDQTDRDVTLRVTDNGNGFEMETAVSGGGLGLTSMQERVASHGGVLTIDTTLNQGTTVTAVLPLT